MKPSDKVLPSPTEWNAKRDRDTVALTVYAVTTQARAAVESIVRERERDHAQAKGALRVWKDALNTLKDGDLHGLRDPSGESSNFLRKHELEAGVRDALARLRVCRSAVEKAVKATNAARAAVQNAHTQMIGGNVRIVSASKRGVEVVIRIGNRSVTRHLLETASGDYTGTSWDKAMIVDYPRNFSSSADPTLSFARFVESQRVINDIAQAA